MAQERWHKPVVPRTHPHHAEGAATTTDAPPKPAKGWGEGVPSSKQAGNCRGGGPPHLAEVLPPTEGASMGLLPKSIPWVLSVPRDGHSHHGGVATAANGPARTWGTPRGCRRGECNRWSRRVSLSPPEFPLGWWRCRTETSRCMDAGGGDGRAGDQHGARQSHARCHTGSQGMERGKCGMKDGCRGLLWLPAPSFASALSAQLGHPSPCTQHIWQGSWMAPRVAIGS